MTFWTVCGAVVLVLAALWVARLLLRFVADQAYVAVARAQLLVLQETEPEFAEWLGKQKFQVVADEDIAKARRMWGMQKDTEELRKDTERMKAERLQREAKRIP